MRHVHQMIPSRRKGPGRVGPRMRCPTSCRYLFNNCPPVGHMKISVIMGNGDHGFAPCLEFRKQGHIKVFPEMRVLIDRPFIKHINRLVLQKRNKERQPFDLSGGQSGMDQAVFLPPDFMVKPCSPEQFVYFIPINLFNTVQSVEQVAIRVHHGEQIPVVRHPDFSAVNDDCT